MPYASLCIVRSKVGHHRKHLKLKCTFKHALNVQVIQCVVKGEWPANLVEDSTISGYIFNVEDDLFFNQDI